MKILLLNRVQVSSASKYSRDSVKFLKFDPHPHILCGKKIKMLSN